MMNLYFIRNIFFPDLRQNIQRRQIHRCLYNIIKFALELETLMKQNSEQKTFVQKILEIENQLTRTVQQFKMKIQYLPATRQINLSRAICELHSRGLKIQHSQFFYEDYERQIYVYFGTYPFSNDIKLKYEYFPAQIIKLRYKRINDMESCKQKAKQKIQHARKTNERTIGEVLASVRKWKELNNMTDQYGKKVHTLESAARIVGIQKKTLDDYNYQIQLGQSFCFDFEKHKNDKIGVLRKFIKQKKEELKRLHNTDNYWALSDSDNDRNSRSENSDS